MNDDELERDLRAHYRAIDPGTAPATLADRVESAMDERGGGSGVIARLRGAAVPLLAAAAVVLVVAGLGLRPGGWFGTAGPVGSTEASVPVDSGSATPSPTSGEASPSSVATPSPAPTTSVSLDAAVVDMAGSFAGGGLWAVRGGGFWTSTDAGDTWRSGTAPIDAPLASGYVPFRAFAVRDANHTWSITSGPGSTDFSGAPTDRLNLIASRTTDGGRTWASTSIPGNYPGTDQQLSFVDARHGFLLITPFRGSLTPGALLQTLDGGETWSVVSTEPSWTSAGTNSWLGSMFTASDATTLWAGAEQEAGPVSHPVLAVSRDGGGTWQNASLPGIGGVGDPYGFDGGAQRYLPAPPLFADASNGLVTVVDDNAEGGTTTETYVYRTSDGGVTWQRLLAPAVSASAGVAVLDPNHWLLPTQNPIGLWDVTPVVLQASPPGHSGGTAWVPVAASGLLNDGWMTWLAGLDSTHAAALVPTTNTTYPALSWLFVSADAGRTWSLVTLPPAP